MRIKDIMFADLLKMFRDQLTHFKQYILDSKTVHPLLWIKKKHDQSFIHSLIHYSCNAGDVLSIKPEALSIAIFHVAGMTEHLLQNNFSIKVERPTCTCKGFLSFCGSPFLQKGPCMQYRQKGNFFLFSMELIKCGFKLQVKWWLKEIHGKEAPNGVSGLLKQLTKIICHDISSNPLTKSETVRVFHIQKRS